MIDKSDKHTGCDDECDGNDDLGSHMVQKAFGALDSEALKTLVEAQRTPEQKRNLTALFEGRFVVDKKK